MFQAKKKHEAENDAVGRKTRAATCMEDNRVSGKMITNCWIEVPALSGNGRSAPGGGL